MNIQTTPQAETHSALIAPWNPTKGVTVIPLDRETRSHVTTGEAAVHLGRQPQTLRKWAMTGSPIQPVRVHTKLLWSVADIRRLLGIGVA